jgi:hypothetical protein
MLTTLSAKSDFFHQAPDQHKVSIFSNIFHFFASPSNISSLLAGKNPVYGDQNGLWREILTQLAKVKFLNEIE